MPVSKAAREGLQAGATVYARVNNIPLAASRSILGVLVSGCPPREPIQSFRRTKHPHFVYSQSKAGNRGYSQPEDSVSDGVHGTLRASQ